MLHKTIMVGLVAMAVGCESKAPLPAAAPKGPATPSQTTNAGPDSEVESGVAKPDKAAEDVTLAIKDYDGIIELIKSHQGKVVVVDCWSTWCDPCMKEFPGLVALHETHGPDKVACISLSLDYEGLPDKKPTDYEENVLKFLHSQRAAFDNVLASTPADEITQKLEFPAPPAVFVYDQEGQLVRMFPGEEAKYETHIAPLVEQLLDEGSGDQ
jgi:thiol-disulfide isomerase/thioredoxin